MTCGSTPNIRFALGERKFVWFKAISKINQLFTITEARWELKQVDKIIASGDCEIDGNDTVRILLEPLERGVYTLCVSYTVPPEVKKAQVNVLVN